MIGTIDLDRNETSSAIWLLDVAAPSSPRRLTGGTRRDQSPRWSPDGRRLAFVSDREGRAQIYVLDLAGGEPVRLTDQATDVSEPVWAPDGTRIAYLADGADRAGDPVPRLEQDGRRRVLRIRQHRHKHDGHGFRGPASRHIWVVPLDGAAGEQITDGAFDDGQVSWSPDGGRIAFVSDRSPDRDDHYEGGAVHVFDLSTRRLVVLTPGQGRAAHPAWSPDGRQIAYVGADEADEAGPANLELRVVSSDGTGEPISLTADLGRSVGMRPGGYLGPSPPVWAAPGGPLYYLIGEGGATHLWRIALDGERERHFDGPCAAATFDADAAASSFALVVSDATTPPEVWGWSAETGPRRLTHATEVALSDIELTRPERLEVQRPDGITLEGWLLPAAGSEPHRRVPLVLSVHGGPHNYFGETWSFDHHLFAARGYAVLYVNPRGSGGYGESFARAVVGDWGGADLEDLLAAVDTVVASGRADGGRIAIYGSSYGGFMACRAITRTERFAVAIAGACISNLISFAGTADIGATWGVREFVGGPEERLDWYLERSAVLHVGRVRTPLLLYHGEDDLRCPIEQSEQMFTALHRLGREVELLRLPGESHGALSSGAPVHRVEARRVILEWLTRYLDRAD